MERPGESHEGVGRKKTSLYLLENELVITYVSLIPAVLELNTVASHSQEGCSML